MSQTEVRRRKAGSDEPKVKLISRARMSAFLEPERQTLPVGIEVGEYYATFPGQEFLRESYQPFHNVARNMGLTAKVRTLDGLLVFRFKQE